MCRVIELSKCGFELSGRSGLADGVGWDNAPGSVIDRLISESYKVSSGGSKPKKAVKHDPDAPAITATSVKKRVLSIGGARR